MAASPPSRPAALSTNWLARRADAFFVADEIAPNGPAWA
jgi:hypothetical protein